MSSYETTCYDRKTGELHEVFCYDNYYGKHEYGYIIDGGKPALDKKEFDKIYTIGKQ